MGTTVPHRSTATLFAPGLRCPAPFLPSSAPPYPHPLLAERPDPATPWPARDHLRAMPSARPP